ncbi:MAG: hypothetical protein ACNI26_16145 [Terasakiella sp.]|uniref:hypothetical protein n=1 Tax=unclassified Terasakiella TaxID=2614952 RepID=UPI003B009284
MSTGPSLLELAEEEIQLAKQEVDDVLGLLSVAEKERDDALIHLQDLKADYFSVQARLQYQEKLLEKRSDIEIEIPNTLDNLETWCQNHLSGSVVVHQRAIKSAKISNFEDVAMIYKVLLILKEHYVPMRKIGGSEYVDKFEAAISEWGLEHTKCFGQKNKAKQFDGEYFITFQGESKELVWHLKGSSSRDGRLGFRLYFFWDDDTKQVVVGYMPGHLKTAQT